MELNLDSIVKLVDSLMVDSIIVHSPNKDEDGTWNETIGVYEYPPGEPKYEGKAQIWSARYGATEKQEGEQDTRVTTYFFEIPRDSPRMLPEDVVVVTAVNEQGNQQLLDVKFTVLSSDMYSFSVSNMFKGEMRDVAVR